MPILNFTLTFISEFYRNYPKLAVTLALSCLTLLSRFLMNQRSRKVFLVDFTCYKPPVTQMCRREVTLERVRLYVNASEETLDFMKKTMESSGLGDSTYLPEALLREPPNPCMKEARKEAEMAMFGSIDTLLEKTSVQCKEIGILIVNCCIFNAVPSLSSMIVNRYKLREDVISYNLSGMGCSAGVLAIGFAKQLLQVHHNSYALVVSTENITENCYVGNDRSNILTNCFFRVGGAAILLSNRPSDRGSSKYQLTQTVQINTASSDRSYNCIFQDEDLEGHVGVTINKDLLVAANKAIKSNVTILGSMILPVSDKLLCLANYTMRRLNLGKLKPSSPDFKRAVDHLCAHVGGKPVLDEVERNLGFNDAYMEASRMTLYRFGNTSSSSVWYELAYSEAKGRVQKGDRVWQIQYGSGFKCSSAVWRALRNIDYDKTNPWSEEIDEFPVHPDNSDEAFPFSFEPSK
ncbi:hypothetical protein RJ640_019667 [Escallonia rubra]|uniref:3-ketoacyl-CoA synthase n=1 Tax=Escallonia rubra TaxID=112253 RepID=A0AA88U3V4_9ASTE|nr:hypothetical protein RJ640_019667 [Escallonia rubra]